MKTIFLKIKKPLIITTTILIACISIMTIPTTKKIVDGIVYLAKNGPESPKPRPQTYEEQLNWLKKNHPEKHLIYTTAMKEIKAGNITDSWFGIKSLMDRDPDYGNALYTELSSIVKETKNNIRFAKDSERLTWSDWGKNNEFVIKNLRHYTAGKIIQLYEEKVSLGYSPDKQYEFCPKFGLEKAEWKLITY